MLGLRRCIALLLLGTSACVSAQTRELDPTRSSFTVEVYKAGLFSAFAHNHEIRAPLTAGRIEGENGVEVRVDARQLRVLDPGRPEKERAEVQQTMLGPTVLDSEHFSEIRFRSTGVERAGEAQWRVRGELTLHGQTHPLSLPVALLDGAYRGATTLRQTDFGITPVRIGGGTVKVKDEVRVEFLLYSR
jgi:polyisoprenoid-binding protein YceI